MSPAYHINRQLGHLIALVVLTGIVLVSALASISMYGAFLLFLVALVFHLAWGWSALICGLILTLFSGNPIFALPAAAA